MRSLLLITVLGSLLLAEEPMQPGPGKFLVAGRKLGDPNFYQTVILMVSYNEKGALGLVINDPTKIPLSKLFDQIEGAGGRSDVIYLGGPVQRSIVHALVRSKTKPENGTLLFGDVYVATSKTFIEKALSDSIRPEMLRVYLGYSGWGAGQLDRELDQGAWQVIRGDADAVFDPKPEIIWERLIRRTELRLAGIIR